MKEAATTNECTSADGHFNIHGCATMQYRRHCLMQHVQAIPEANGCCHQATTHSVLPRRRQGNRKQNNNIKCTRFLCWPFRWPWRCTGTIPCAMPNDNQGGPGLSKKPLNATIRQALAPIGINWTCLPLFWGFISWSN